MTINRSFSQFKATREEGGELITGRDQTDGHITGRQQGTL